MPKVCFHMGSIMQDSSISRALAMAILQSCIKPSIYSSRMIRNRRLYRYSLDALQQEADVEEDHTDLVFGKRKSIQSPSCTQPQSQAQQRTQPSSRSPNPCQRSPLQSTTQPQPQQGRRQVQGHSQGQGQNRYAPNDMHYRRGPQKSQPITLEISERPVSGTQHSVIKYREVSPMSLPRARHPIVGQPESQGLVGSDPRCGRRQILMPESYHNYKINLGDLNKRVVYC